MKRQNHILLNIGLENNPKGTREILTGLEFIFGRIGEFAEVKSEWQGATERTLVVSVATSLKLSTIIREVEYLCSSMNQDAIGARIFEDNFKRSIDLLIYSPTHKGDRMDFDKDFFKRLPVD